MITRKILQYPHNNKRKYSLNYKEISREAEMINIKKIFQSDWLREDEKIQKQINSLKKSKN